MLRRFWQQSLYRQVVSETWRVAPGATSLLLALVGISGVLSALVVVLIGATIGRLPAAIEAGAGSSAARDAMALVVWVGVVVIVQQLIGAVFGVLPLRLGRRLEGSARSRVMAAASAPTGVAHLADPAVRDAIDGATTLGTGRSGPMWAVDALVPMSVTLCNGLAMAILVGLYRWWIGIVLALGWLWARTTRRRDNVAQSAIIGSDSFGTRRQAYFRQLTLTPPAAQEIRVFGLGKWLVDRFHAQWVESVESVWTTRREARPALLPPLIAVAIANALAFGFVTYDAWNGVIGLREFTVVVQAIVASAAMAEPGATVLVDAGFVRSAQSLALAPRLEAITQSLEIEPGGSSPLPSDATLRFDNVSFRYPRQDHTLLHDLDLVVPSGQSLALVGSNGAGKTTIVRLLARLLTPTSGSITVGGVPIAALPTTQWRANLAIVFQDFAHFELTARENIEWGAIDRRGTDADLNEIARRVRLDQVAERFTRGWETPLSRQLAGGTDLSGGQWQRVALARALWAVRHGATILILDEPTANLDVRAEADFYDQFLALTQGLTTIVISHRYATVRRADRIAVLDNGRIIELGSHDELMARGATYAANFKIQAAAFAEPTSDA